MSQRLIAVAALVWTAGLLATHLAVPATWQWSVVATFSILMNLTYPLEAFWRRQWRLVELGVAGVLIAASVAGVVLSPWWLVAAVLGHGVWDFAKHKGAGVRFFSWYTLSCAAIDGLWAAGMVVLITQAG